MWEQKDGREMKADNSLWGEQTASAESEILSGRMKSVERNPITAALKHKLFFLFVFLLFNTALSKELKVHSKSIGLQKQIRLFTFKWPHISTTAEPGTHSEASGLFSGTNIAPFRHKLESTGASFTEMKSCLKENVQNLEKKKD